MIKLKLFLLATLLSLANITAHAHDFKVDGIYYNIISEGELTCEVVGEWGAYEGDIVIPSSVTHDGKTYSVTRIGQNAFCKCPNVTSVVLPNSLTSIEWYAFYGCEGLSNIVIPEGVRSIEQCAFLSCKNLVQVVIPESVTFIGDCAFGICPNLPVFNNIIYAGTAAVEAVDKTLTTYTLLENTRHICYDAFRGCENLTSLTIPNGVKSIGYRAFEGCSNLVDINIPESVIQIDYWAFEGCTSLPVIDNIRYADTYAVEAVDKTLSSYTLKENTRFIGSEAFKGCWSDMNGYPPTINIPESVISIGYEAFAYSDFEEISLPKNLMSIDERAFYGCVFLQGITIPESVKRIGDHAFAQSLIQHANILGSLTFFGEYVFRECGNLDNVTISGSTKSIPRGTFFKSMLSSVTLPESVTIIDDEAFSECTCLLSVNIPQKVTRIGFEAFYLSGLSSIVLPESLTRIDDSAFGFCEQLSYIKIPESVTSLGDGAFTYCSSLSSIEIPDGVVSIGDQTFLDCHNLSSISIPKSVTSIGNWAFCSTALSSIDLPESVTSIGDGAFCGCDQLSDIRIPESVTSIGDFAFEGCKKLTDVTLPESIKGIERGTFQYCEALKDIVLPMSVQYVSREAFDGCSCLTNITMGYNITRIDENAFSNCPSLACVDLMAPDGDAINKSKAIVSSMTPKPQLRVQPEAVNFFGNTKWTDEFDVVISPDPICIDLKEKVAYTNQHDLPSATVTYKRTFNRDAWQALYLPFDVPYEEWSEYGQVAEVNAVHQYYGEDKTVVIVEFHKLKAGDKVHANTPYVFKVNSDWLNVETIWGGANRAVKAANNGQVWCASSRSRFTITGVYEQTSFEGKYAIANGGFVLGGPTAYVDPYRIILSIESENHGYGENEGMESDSEVRPAIIGLMIDGEETSGIDEFSSSNNSNATVHDLQGRRVSNPNKGGMYIVGGKKVVY